MHWKYTAAVTGVTLLGAWMAGAPPVATSVVSSPPPGAATASPGVEIRIEDEARRLAAGMRREVRDLRPGRNPFRFGEVAPPPIAVSPATPDEPEGGRATEAVGAVPLEPAIVLVGMATALAGGGSVLTAVLSTPQGLVLARQGDVVGQDYRVTAIESGAVELSTTDGRSRRILLKP